MANHKQALKRHRQSLERRDRNRQYKSRMANAIKRLAQIKEEGNAEAVQKAFREAISLVAKVASKGVIPKTRAARKIARLTKAFGK